MEEGQCQGVKGIGSDRHDPVPCTPKPTRPCSLMGMFSTRSSPNSSRNPMVARKTPPNATSSPKTTALSSVLSAILQDEGAPRAVVIR
eukprot:scaffold113141_cov28-Tisochrysis_lutea.AAC.1